jgi:hypothetical protein
MAKSKKQAKKPHSVKRIGTEWQGGIYAGIARGVNGASDHHLIVAQVGPEPLAWPAAKKWAEGLDCGGSRDWSLPTRKEQALLFANVGDLFKPNWYWSGEQHASYPGYAWGQYFDNGYQSYGHEGSYGRARAVRRYKI